MSRQSFTKLSVPPPLAAITKRNNTAGVFIVDPDGSTVSWRAVEEVVRDENRVQVTGKGIADRVVVLEKF